MKTRLSVTALIVVLVLALAGCGGARAHAEADPNSVTFTLTTGIAGGRMAFVGVGGAIDGIVDPDLAVAPGAQVRLIVKNGDGMTHDLAIPDLQLKTQPLAGQGSDVELDFVAPAATGSYSYHCTVAGHRQAGMEGMLVVGAAH